MARVSLQGMEVRATMQPMNTTSRMLFTGFVGLGSLAAGASCGGKVIEYDSYEAGTSSSDGGSGSSSGGIVNDASLQPDSSVELDSSLGGDDASEDATSAAECSTQIALGVCTFCNNLWLCPQPNMPLPACPPGVQEYTPCDSALNGCIECAPDGSASYWPCMFGQLVLQTNLGVTCQ